MHSVYRIRGVHHPSGRRMADIVTHVHHVRSSHVEYTTSIPGTFKAYATFHVVDMSHNVSRNTICSGIARKHTGTHDGIQRPLVPQI
jgi:hypothetical protein